uniref:Anaphase-promoting complex subunit 4-like WD40 domain-containing protein n=1 Tax=Phlebotomus papatasi TaxID=29031 RepID=A0A1B0DD13_PHLPP
MSIVNLHSFHTKYFADSVEWCLHPQHGQIFACGTYQLDDSTSEVVRRKGSILILSFSLNGSDSDLQLLHERETDGILDQKWLKNLDIPLLATATSSGNIELFSWQDSQLGCITSHRIDAEVQDNIALSLDWNSQNKQILVSDSKGYISLLDLANNSTINLINRWKAHSFEAWTCSFYKNNPDIVLTVSDTKDH